MSAMNLLEVDKEDVTFQKRKKSQLNNYNLESSNGFCAPEIQEYNRSEGSN